MGEVRLNKIIRSYNIGLQNLVNFLKTKGLVVPPNPNAKISDSYLPAIENYFNNDNTKAMSFVKDQKYTMRITGVDTFNGRRSYVVVFGGTEYRIKMYPFQRERSGDIGCIYVGTNDSGRPQFIQDFQDVLKEVYSEGMVYPFKLFSECTDQNTGAFYYNLSDDYGLYHRVYNQRLRDIKVGDVIKARVLAIEKNYLSLDILPNPVPAASYQIGDIVNLSGVVNNPVKDNSAIDFSKLNPEADTTLRDYQTDNKRKIYEAWRTCRSVMLQMPTGTGKTRLFVSIARDLFNYGVNRKKAVKILFLAHRKELIEQISDHLGRKYNLAHGLIMSQSLEQKKFPMQIGSVPTLTRRLQRWDDKDFDVIIIDEAHHVKAKSYKKIIDLYPNAKILGVTATPYRLNGAGFRPEFDELIVSPSVAEFIKSGYLSEYEYYSIKPNSLLQKAIDHMKLDFEGDYKESEMMGVMDRDHIRAGILATYQKFASGKKGIVYTISKDHNTHLAAAFNKAGIVSAAIDSDTPKEKRDEMVQKFKRGEIQVLFNVNIFSEGFDCPDVEVIQLARPTKSLAMYLQQVGRGLRPHDSKEKLIILDNVGLFNKFGFPSARRKWRYHFEGKPVDESPASNLIDNDENRVVKPIYEGDEDIEMLHDSRTEDVSGNALDSVTHDYSQSFLEYASTLLTATTANNYVREIRTRLDEYIRTHRTPEFKGIFSIIDYDSLMSIYNGLRADREFVAFNKEKHNVFTAALRRYIEFAASYSQQSSATILPPPIVSEPGQAIKNDKLLTTAPEMDEEEIDKEIDSIRRAISFSQKRNFPIPKEMTDELERLIRIKSESSLSASLKKDVEQTLEKIGVTGVRSFDYDIASQSISVTASFDYETAIKDEKDMSELLRLMERFNVATIPEEIRKSHTQIQEAKQIQNAIASLRTTLSALVSLKKLNDSTISGIHYSESDGVSILKKTFELVPPEVSPAKASTRNSPQRFKVTLSDGSVICRNKAKDTYLDALEAIGPNNIKDFEMIINGRPFFDHIPHPKYANQSYLLSNRSWVNTNITTEKKVAIIKEISAKYNLGLKVELI